MHLDDSFKGDLSIQNNINIADTIEGKSLKEGSIDGSIEGKSFQSGARVGYILKQISVYSTYSLHVHVSYGEFKTKYSIELQLHFYQIL